MSITSIGWATDQVIRINKSDMTQVQITPVEIYRLDTDQFFRDLKDAERTAEGMPWPDTQRNAPPVTLGGITYARVLEILDPYTVTFEDGSYVVQLTGSNNNIIEKTNPNQVSVQGNNAAGLIQVPEIQYGAFQGGVTLDQVNGSPGQGYPAGTPLQPVDNLADALFICALRGFDKIYVHGTYVFAPTDVVDGIIFDGDSPVRDTMVLTSAASITNCIFRDMTITGDLDGGNSASHCIVSNINYIDGSLEDCLVVGTVVLGGTQANLIRCGSGVAGGGPGLTPTLDFGGGGTDLLIRDWQGGLTLVNQANPGDNISIDMSSGRLIVDPSCTESTIYVRGVAQVIDNSTGNCEVVNHCLFGQELQEVATRLGLKAGNPVTDTPTGISSAQGDIDIARTGDGVNSSTLTRQ